MSRKHLTEQDWIEICDLYDWGARVADIAMLYDRSVKYISAHVKLRGCIARAAWRPVQVAVKRAERIKSTRPSLPAGVAVVEDGRAEIDQLLRSSAHASQAQRIEERRLDANIRSCLEAAS